MASPRRIQLVGEAQEAPLFQSDLEPSGENILGYVSVDIRESKVPTRKSIGELFVVESE